MPVDISVLLHTVSRDDFLSERGIRSYFQALVDCLARQQGAPSFELVYTDAHWGANVAHHAEITRELPFVVKHVPLHRLHRYYFDRGHCFISAAKNNGILYADGELCVSIDDAELLHEILLSRYWAHYRASPSLLGHALHRRLKSLKTQDGRVSFPISGDEYVNDNRWKMTPGAHDHGSMLFAGTSFALEDMLMINGFDEQMDGCKSLEDSEAGYRLARIGKRFVMDHTLFVYIVDHASYSDYSINCGWDASAEERSSFIPGKETTITNFIAVENYGMLMARAEIGEVEANRHPPTERHMNVIRRETLKYRHFDPLSAENAERLKLWLGVPQFDLREQRAQLRASTEWRW